MLKYKYILLLLSVMGMFSCKKSSMPIYEQRAGLYFSAYEFSYSFIDNPDLPEKTTLLPVAISGNAVDYDREFTIRTPETDTITTAEIDQYILEKGVVPAGSFSGLIGVTLKNDERLRDSTYTLFLEVAPSPEFPELKLNKTYMRLYFTAKIIQPANWGWLRYYFGVYSTGWWKFIMKTTNKTSLPYFPTNPDKETWWMSVGELQANQALVRIALMEYNAGPKGPLVHDDGPNAKLPVTMP